MRISLDLSGDAERQLAETAKRLSVPVRDWAAAAVCDLLARPAEDFERAAAHVLSTHEAPSGCANATSGTVGGQSARGFARVPLQHRALALVVVR